MKVIRTFKPGDEAAQVQVYNSAAAALPKFKPATLQEVQRRIRARDFESTSRYYAETDGRVVGYATYSANGRVSYPWCLAGYEDAADPLFKAVQEGMKKRGLKTAFAAYRGDWPSVHEFFLKRGFQRTREMVNFVIDLIEMPTPAARASSAITPVTPEDVPAILAMTPEALRVSTPQALHDHLFKNPHFAADDLFALRGRHDNEPIAVGILVNDPTFADAKMIDASMPCFRLGAFGTEGMQVKRVRALFSLLTRADANLASVGMDLMGYAAFRLRDSDDVDALAGQVPSDVPRLLAFYERNFKKQGSFPVFEKTLV